MSISQFPINVDKYYDADEQKLYVHVITETDSTDYISDDHDSLPTQLTNGEIVLNLRIKVDPLASSSLSFMTPVVHDVSFDVSQMLIDGNHAPLNVSVLNEEDEIVANRKIGDEIAETTPAEDDTKPYPS